ncbi:MAG: dipeptide epimerase [Saprospiraceae bacterium]|nr:dipeptide epimerase [Saprospiraceae bacterium]
MRLHLHTYQLELEHAFTIAHGSRTVQPTLIVELEDEGVSGYGEATATSYYGQKLDEMIERLESLRPLIESTNLRRPEALWERLRGPLKDHPFEHCALDVAANDLYARKLGQPLYKVWGLQTEDLPLSNYTIGIDSKEKMAEKMAEKPWPVYKIKMGTDRDMEILRYLRERTDALFRIDANTAWTAKQTIERSAELEELGVEFIEQPLPPEAWLEMRSVYQQSALPVIADESCRREEDVERCHGHFHGINIKLMKCGGLTPARRMIEHARQLDMKVMVGCMTESSVGISAIAQLLPLLDYVDMDGALLLKNDPATGVCIDQGKVYFPDKAGTGADLNR